MVTAVFQKKWKPSVYLLQHGVIQFISEENSKKMNGRAEPEMGGSPQQTNEQLAMSYMAKPGMTQTTSMIRA